MAFPQDLDAGSVVLIVNADNTVLRYAVPQTYRATVSPLTRSAESSSRVTGIGSPSLLDGARCFPALSGVIGASD